MVDTLKVEMAELSGLQVVLVVVLLVEAEALVRVAMVITDTLVEAEADLVVELVHLAEEVLDILVEQLVVLLLMALHILLPLLTVVMVVMVLLLSNC